MSMKRRKQKREEKDERKREERDESKREEKDESLSDDEMPVSKGFRMIKGRTKLDGPPVPKSPLSYFANILYHNIGYVAFCCSTTLYTYFYVMKHWIFHLIFLIYVVVACFLGWALCFPEEKKPLIVDGMYFGDILAKPLGLLAHGSGLSLYRDGSSYAGQWVQNEFSGMGIHFLRDQTVYEGEFKSNKWTGHGTLKLPDGAFFAGSFQGTLDVKDGIWRHPIDSESNEEASTSQPMKLTGVKDGRAINITPSKGALDVENKKAEENLRELEAEATKGVQIAVESRAHYKFARQVAEEAKMKTLLCVVCQKKSTGNSSVECPGCHDRWYCSSKCGTDDRKDHEYDCITAQLEMGFKL